MEEPCFKDPNSSSAVQDPLVSGIQIALESPSQISPTHSLGLEMCGPISIFSGVYSPGGIECTCIMFPFHLRELQCKIPLADTFKSDASSSVSFKMEH